MTVEKEPGRGGGMEEGVVKDEGMVKRGKLGREEVKNVGGEREETNWEMK